MTAITVDRRHDVCVLRLPMSRHMVHLVVLIGVNTDGDQARSTAAVHLLEHMILEQGRDGISVAQMVEEVGGSISAAVSLGLMRFSFAVPRSVWNTGAKVLGCILSPLQIDTEKFQTAQRVVVNELLERSTSPYDQLQQVLLRQALGLASPHAGFWGSADTVETLTPCDIESGWDLLFSDRLVLGLAGDDTVLSALNDQALSRVVSVRKDQRGSHAVAGAGTAGWFDATLSDNEDIAYFGRLLFTPTLSIDDEVKLRLWGAYISADWTGALARSLRGQGLVYWLEDKLTHLPCGMAWMLLGSCRKQDLDRVKAAITTAVSETMGPGPLSLEAARQFVCGQYARLMDEAHPALNVLARQVFWQGDFLTAEAMDARVHGVTESNLGPFIRGLVQKRPGELGPI